MKTLAEILEDQGDFTNLLENHTRYYAHRADGQLHKDDEHLHEHINLVNDFVIKLCKLHGLDEVINRLITHIVSNTKGSFSDKVAAAATIKEQFAFTFLFHDFGKINPNFQRDKMGKTQLFPEVVDVPFFPSSGHSELSAFAYLRFFTPRKLDENSFLLFYTALILSYPIIRHHAPNLYSIDKYFEDRKQQWRDKIADFERLLRPFIGLPAKGSSILEELLQRFDSILEVGEYAFKESSMEIFSLIKLNFSLLTAADYLATSAYANDKDFSLDGVLHQATKEAIIEAARTSLPYNRDIYEASERNDFVFREPKSPSNESLNQLRKEMGVKVINAVRKQPDGQLFYIEAPTGGGKTNLSMLATAELLRLNPDINKVIYVFPFTTLVTQTYKGLMDTFQLSEDSITQLHAKAGYKGAAAEDKEDGRYGKDKQDYLAYLFNHFPVTLCTHIRFFDWLITPQKESNYAMHRLANSIVVIDELQAYNPKHWDKVMLFIQHFAEYFNTHFIIMSATLPKLGDLLANLGKAKRPVVHLLENAKELYFCNPNFQQRVQFDTSLLSETMEVPRLADIVLAKSREYADTNSLYPNSVYTIVECIFKRTATELYDVIESLPAFFNHVFVLSGTILEHRRRLIINRLKHPAYRKKKILLITTQVVEAGVDIDMDLGFKDRSIIDSDEQLAGRINRNVKKPRCKLYLFQKDRASILYRNDLRFEISREKLKRNDIYQILNNKDFDRVYSLVFDKIEEDNRSKLLKNIEQYLNLLAGLRYDKIYEEFRLIENSNLSLFVPMEIPLYVEGQEEGVLDYIFSTDELDFLKCHDIAVEDSVDGVAVFELYLKMINKELSSNDFITGKTNFIRLQGVMSKFIFSMFKSDKFEQKIRPFTHHENSQYGFIYLSEFKAVYNEEAGLLDSAIDDVTHQIIC